MTMLGQLRSGFRGVPTPNFAYSGSELDALSEGRNYYRSLVESFRPWIGKQVVEVGAGIGTFAQHLLSIETVESLVALEPGKNTFPLLRQRLEGNSRAEPIRAYLHQIPALDADSVVAVNVMEHVENDLDFLQHAHRVTHADGKLLLYVPALPAIYGSLDVALEHHRRYTRKTLRKVMEEAGWFVEKISYVNLPGVLAWYVAGRILRKTSISGAEVGIYDRFVIPLTSRLEKIWSPPIGQSLIAIGSKSLR